MNFCKDCRHIRSGKYFAECAAHVSFRSLVTGKETLELCLTAQALCRSPTVNLSGGGQDSFGACFPLTSQAL